MKFSFYLFEMVIIFLITFITSSVVVYLYNLLIHDSSFVEFTTSLRFAIIFAIIYPFINRYKMKHKVK